ncbi:MAG: FeoA family protein [Candidatus Omnitrophica bacterium]|nr:FeoA family protein [Candidatus Omnitrophota bacterium]
MRKLPLAKLRDNQKARIIEIQAGKALVNRYMSMGIYPGREVTKLSQFMLRGPVAIKVGRTVLALGYGMAHKIIVELE